MKFKVRYMMDDNYEVVELTMNEKDSDSDETERNEESVYQGRLSDCEAYIRLREDGYLS